MLCETIRRCTVQGLLSLFSRHAITEMYNYYYGTPYGLCFSIGNWLCCVSLWEGLMVVVNLHKLHIRQNYILVILKNWC